MEFRELLDKRFSARTYTSVEVDESAVQEMLEAVKAAPSAGNLQSYHVVVVRDSDKKQKLADASGPQGWIAKAPVVFAFFADMTKFCSRYSNTCHPTMSTQDATIAIAYAQLAAANLGLGSCWVGPFAADDAQEICGLEGDLVFAGLLTLGHTAESQTRRKRRNESEWTTYI